MTPANEANVHQWGTSRCNMNFIMYMNMKINVGINASTVSCPWM